MENANAFWRKYKLTRYDDDEHCLQPGIFERHNPLSEFSLSIVLTRTRNKNCCVNDNEPLFVILKSTFSRTTQSG